ncbi:unnamed protein product [Peniophora sp. CBMAI 1063]|nr:unnamed protein product [Peniophora sp. CBMAI 1063]
MRTSGAGDEKGGAAALAADSGPKLTRYAAGGTRSGEEAKKQRAHSNINSSSLAEVLLSASVERHAAQRVPLLSLTTSIPAGRVDLGISTYTLAASNFQVSVDRTAVTRPVEAQRCKGAERWAAQSWEGCPFWISDRTHPDSLALFCHIDHQSNVETILHIRCITH